jgi:integrase
MTVKRGHTVVKVYKTPSNGCDQFTVSYYLGEKRIRKTFADPGLAITEAETTATALSAGELSVVELKGDARLSYVRSTEILQPTGIPLEMAAMQAVALKQILGDVPPEEAARYYMKHHPVGLPRKAVGEVVEELIAAKEADGMSDFYRKDLRIRLQRFERAFHEERLSAVSTAQVEDFLRNLKQARPQAKDAPKVEKSISGRSRNNYRGAIRTLFAFAEARGYLPKGDGRIEAVAVAKESDSPIEIFTPEEMAKLFANAKPAMIPFLAIGAFAGLRHAEITRLDWSDVRIKEGFIEVKALNAKTASRRLVPITPNLKRWLHDHRQESGLICAHDNMANQIVRLVESAGVPWKHNALRRSFISYRVAAIQNVAQVALEAGNSPRMVFSNYRELVRPAEAKKWFGILPSTVKELRPAIVPKLRVLPTAAAGVGINQQPQR